MQAFRRTSGALFFPLLSAPLVSLNGQGDATGDTEARRAAAVFTAATDRPPEERKAAPGPDTSRTNRPVFTDITEIVMVVEDLDASVRQQWEMFGIGPWEIWTLDPSNVRDMVVHGKAQPFAIKIAYTKIGNIHWELIEPLDEKSTYYDTLRDRGEGVHNIVFAVEDYDRTVQHMEANGIGHFNSGNWQGTRFVNFDTRKHLPVIAEIFSTTAGGQFPVPDSTYPARPAASADNSEPEQ